MEQRYLTVNHQLKKSPVEYTTHNKHHQPLRKSLPGKVIYSRPTNKDVIK